MLKQSCIASLPLFIFGLLSLEFQGMMALESGKLFRVSERGFCLTAMAGFTGPSIC